ncbi:AsnC family protein [Bradyrhizobium quebecense]|uniref:Helix-turn-helix domain-containing protein n=1 Tax=Bradyrhizobium quebecense TaxID=2748629 RepID=A0A973WPL9_9BRAD|nr:AsnC family protein [Bradyrhizobium quebecense]UGA45990.1 AsnC family protein [Bradyrhizobium quebecense]
MTKPLPGILQEIADVIGEAGALSIAARHGGTRVYIPSAARLDWKEYWLVECVGHDLAKKLCEHFQVDGRGQRIDIPLHIGGTYRQFVRSIHERVERLEHQGASSTEIARRIGLSQRTVHRRRAKLRVKNDGKQGRLF